MILPFSEESFCQTSVIVQGVELGSPHFALPFKGINFILGNDCAGGKGMSVPEVLDRPNPSLESTSAQDQPLYLPSQKSVTLTWLIPLRGQIPSALTKHFFWPGLKLDVICYCHT